MKRCSLIASIVIALLGVMVQNAKAQWLSQTVTLTNGWNAVFLHVDLSYTNIAMVMSPDPNITMVSLWTPPGTLQFVNSPSQPINGATGWRSWVRGQAENSLDTLMGDSAYLVYVANATSYTWTVKGKPVAPRAHWNASGLNLIGFSTAPVNAPFFPVFLKAATELTNVTEIYRYVGGEISSNNPSLLTSFLQKSKAVTRGQAFWIRQGTAFNHFFGPFEVFLPNGSGVDFGTESSVVNFRLRNHLAATSTVTVSFIGSETPPANQSSIVGTPPLLVRGPVNTTNLTYGYTALNGGGTFTWTLAPRDQPGSDVQVVIGLNRSALTATPGQLFAGVLRFTDSLGYSQVDVPVSAGVGSNAGLWVGSASTAQVGEYLKTYRKDATGTSNVTAYDVAPTTVTSNTVVTGTPGFSTVSITINVAEGGGSGKSNILANSTAYRTTTKLIGLLRRNDQPDGEFITTSTNTTVFDSGITNIIATYFVVSGLTRTTNNLTTFSTNIVITYTTNLPNFTPATAGYVVVSTNTLLGDVASPFTQRLIVFSSNSTPAMLFQRLYCGVNGSNQVISTAESALNPAYLAQARRVSTVDLPWTNPNHGWAFNANLQSGGVLTSTVTTSFDDQASNPFLHIYHPDHNNVTKQGSQSYTVVRQITLTPQAPRADFASLTAGNKMISGVYAEAITVLGLGVNSQSFQVQGVFTLNHISNVSTLTPP